MAPGALEIGLFWSLVFLEYKIRALGLELEFRVWGRAGGGGSYNVIELHATVLQDWVAFPWVRGFTPHRRSNKFGTATPSFRTQPYRNLNFHPS